MRTFNRASKRQIPPFLAEHWLRMFLVALAVGLSGGGYLIYQAGKAPKLELTSLPKPPAVDVFVSDRRASVQLTVTLITGSVSLEPPLAPRKLEVGSPLSAGPWLATIAVNVSVPKFVNTVRWVVQLSGAESNASTLRFANPPAGGPIGSDVYEGETRPQDLKVLGGTGVVAGAFATEPLAVSKGNVVGRLPDLGSQFASSFPLDSPQFGIETSPAPTGREAPSFGTTPIPPQLGLLPGPLDTQPQHQPQLRHGPTIENQAEVLPAPDGSLIPARAGDEVIPFYPPHALVSTDMIFADLTNYQIVTEYPPHYIPSNGSIAWQAAGEIAPNFTAIENGATDARANDALLAGVFLATGAAALIALLQEMRVLQMARQRRKRSDDEQA